MSAVWDTMIGQDAALASLRAGLDSGRAAHAYLFRGPDGVGKRTAALGLAQRLNCTGADKPCGDCAACRQIAGRAHSELRLIEPEPMGEGGRGQVHKIETIRELQADASLRPFGDAWRMYLLNAADRLNEAAANCLLKTLEEPPPHVVLVLCSEEPAALLPTILSRVRSVTFGPVPREAIAAWLRRVHDVPADEAEVLAGIAAGRPGRALVLAREPAVRQLRADLAELVLGLRGAPAVSALAAGERLRAGLGDESAPAGIELALEMLEWWYRDALVLRVTGDPEQLVGRDQRAALERFVAGCPPEEPRLALTALHEARIAYRRNANTALLLETLWLRLRAAASGPG